MNRSRQNSAFVQQLKTDGHTDARVEVLLFLGIFFWCWLLAGLVQEKIFIYQQPPFNLRWDGHVLRAQKQAKKNAAVLSEIIIPAMITPFFFQPVPINLADQELLTTISGIGPGLAAQIIATRNKNGYFLSSQDLRAVPGIGPFHMNQFAPHFSFQAP